MAPDTPDAPGTSPPEGPAASRDEAVARRMNDPNATALEKALAALVGAAEGFAEEARKADLPGLAAQTVDTVSATVRELRGGFERPGGPPPAASTLAGQDYLGTPPAGGFGTSPTFGAESLETVGTYGAETPPASARATAGLQRAEHVASAVGASARRAMEVPAAVAYEVRTTARAVARDVATSLVGYALTGVLAVFALALFTVVAAVFLNRALGDPIGTLLIGILYVVGAVVAVVVGRHAMNEARDDAREGAERVRTEVGGVTAPLRDLRS